MLLKVDTHSLFRSAGETRACATNIGDQIDAIRWAAASVGAPELIESNVGFSDQPHVVGMLAGLLDEVRTGAESADSADSGLQPSPALLALSAWLASSGTSPNPTDCNYYPYDVSTTRFVISSEGMISGELEPIGGVYLKSEGEIYGEVTVDSAGNYVVNLGGQSGVGAGFDAGGGIEVAYAGGTMGMLQQFGTYTTLKFSSKKEYDDAMNDLKAAVKNDASSAVAMLNPFFLVYKSGQESTSEVLDRLWKENGESTTFTASRGLELEGEAGVEARNAVFGLLGGIEQSLNAEGEASESLTGYVTVPADGSAVVVGAQYQREVDAEGWETQGLWGLGVAGVGIEKGLVASGTGTQVIDIHADTNGNNVGASVTTTGTIRTGTTQGIELGFDPPYSVRGRVSQQEGQSLKVTMEYAGDDSLADAAAFVAVNRYIPTPGSADTTVQTLQESTDTGGVELRAGSGIGIGLDASVSMERTTTETVSSQFTPAGGSPIDQVATEGGKSCEIQ